MNIAKNESITLFVGAGAVNNSWKPIIRALQPAYFTNELTDSGATCGLARLVYLLRWTSSNPNKDTFNKCKQILENAKQKICEEIKISHQKNEITIRKEFWNLVNQIIISNCKRLMIVSTNWDTVVEDAINSTAITRIFDKKLFAAHLHGVYLDPQNIYLPSEMIEEPYRTEKEKQILGGMHVSVIKSTNIAHTIIFYGLSISPLDAELSQILGSCFYNDSVKVIKIVDPNHKEVAERINLLLKYPTNVAVHGYDPSDLHSLIDYSLH